MSDDFDMTRLGAMKGHPNAPVSEKDIDAWVTRIDDVSTAITDFLQSDPDELDRRREARRKEITERERELKKQQIQERYNVAFYRKYEDDKFIDELLANVDKKESDEEQRKKKAIQVSKEHQMTDFERIALEEARKTRLRANDLVMKQSYAEAHELYSTIISLNPDDDALLLAARNNRALTSLKLTPTPNYTQAVEDATFVISRDPKNVKARLRRAAALLSGLHRPKEAIDDLRVVLKCDSNVKEAKEMMIAAQRDAEETEAADKVTIEDKQGCEKFCLAMDSLSSMVFLNKKEDAVEELDGEASSSKKTGEAKKKKQSPLEKMFHVAENSTSKSFQKSADSEVAKFCRTLLEHLVVLSESVSLDDAFTSLFRLKDGFSVVVKICSVLANALIFETVEEKKFLDVTEAILVLSASLRLLAAVLNVDRTATAFFANSPQALKEIFDICVKILAETNNNATKQLQQSNSSNNNKNHLRIFSILASSMALLSHIINNSIFESDTNSNQIQSSYSWKNLSSETKSTVVSVILKNSQQASNNNNPLLSDTMLLSAAVMLTDQGANELTTKMNSSNNNSNKMASLLFAQLDSISMQQDFSSPRSKSAATLLLRISSKREIAVDISKNLEKLIKLLFAIMVNKNNIAVRFGILVEGLLSAIHNAVVLQAVQRTDLAKQIVSLPASSFIPKIFETISDNIDSCVNTYSSVVSKLFAILAKTLTISSEAAGTGGSESETIAKVISQNSCFFTKMILPLSRSTLHFVNQKRVEKAKKLADSDNISDLAVVRKTADLWVGGLNNNNNANVSSSMNGSGGISQVNLLENISLIAAALFQTPNNVTAEVDFSKINNLKMMNPSSNIIVDSVQVQFSKLAFELIRDMSFCAPRVSGNAAVWITSKLALDPLVIKYWTTVDEKILTTENGDEKNALSKKNTQKIEIENPKVRAEKLIKILLSGVKDVSSLMYDAERSENGNKARSAEDQHQKTILLTALKGARRNVAVAAAKLCAVEGGLFVEEFRSQGGTQLFGSLQIS